MSANILPVPIDELPRNLPHSDNLFDEFRQKSILAASQETFDVTEFDKFNAHMDLLSNHIIDAFKREGDEVSVASASCFFVWCEICAEKSLMASRMLSFLMPCYTRMLDSPSYIVKEMGAVSLQKLFVRKTFNAEQIFKAKAHVLLLDACKAVFTFKRPTLMVAALEASATIARKVYGFCSSEYLRVVDELLNAFFLTSLLPVDTSTLADDVGQDEFVLGLLKVATLFVAHMNVSVVRYVKDFVEFFARTLKSYSVRESVAFLRALLSVSWPVFKFVFFEVCDAVGHFVAAHLQEDAAEDAAELRELLVCISAAVGESLVVEKMGHISRLYPQKAHLFEILLTKANEKAVNLSSSTGKQVAN